MLAAGAVVDVVDDDVDDDADYAVGSGFASRGAVDAAEDSPLSVADACAVDAGVGAVPGIGSVARPSSAPLPSYCAVPP